MGFGEDYQGMTDREILIELAGDVRGLREDARDRPPCPSPRCGEHEARLTRVETILAVVGGAVIVLVPVIMWLVDKVWRGP